MIPYKEAIDIIEFAASEIVLSKQSVPLSLIEGRICANDIRSPLSMPPFDNAAMDGFALRAEECAKKLPLKTHVIAGDTVAALKLLPGECCAIMTGAPVPEGADSIIPVEQSTVDKNTVSFAAKAKCGDHIRKAGSDFARGDLVVEQGTILSLRHILPLAALGIGEVNVYARPKVAFIATGREIVDTPGQKLKEGQIYNSNLPYAAAFLRHAGAEVLPQATIPDNPALFQKTIKSLMQDNVPLIISSGAVSAGSHDFIRNSLEETGAHILFHKVAIKPGKPVLFAKLPNGSLYLGLPGNPVSTAVGLRFFVAPLLAALTGQKPEPRYFARAKTSLSRKPGLRLFLKARMEVSPTGVLEAEFLDGQESYKTGPFLSMNSWAVAPEDKQAIDINDIIEVFPLSLFS